MKPQISQSRENVDDNFFEINGIYYTKNDSGETLSVTLVLLNTRVPLIFQQV